MNNNYPSRKRHYRGFTFVEIMLAITIMAISFFPILTLLTDAVHQTNLTSEISTALSLGREGMEMVRNLNLPVDRLEQVPEVWYPELDDPALLINKQHWRIHTIFHQGSRPLQVDIEVFQEEGSKPYLRLTTLFEDLF